MKKFELNDIKTGNLVITREGKRMVVLRNQHFFIGLLEAGICMPLHKHNEETMLDDVWHENDIMEVYDVFDWFIILPNLIQQTSMERISQSSYLIYKRDC